ncbi:MAG: dihydroorotate dehydrogenase electron transfer subunit [Candidatus Bathyarchaeia archaeon]
MSAYLTAINKLRTTSILSAKAESPTVKTFTFKDKQCAKAKPGQFLMLWIPGIDEIPLSILNAEKKGTIAVVVKKIGEATKALHNKKVGELIGIRGPFGNSFTLKEGKILMVGGGTGIAPLLFLTRRLVSKTAKISFVIGASTKEELLFINELKALCSKENVIAATEDGSYGVKGLATEPVEALLANEKFDIIYTCGPEQMIRKVFDLAEKHEIALEASLERLMRCAIGLCGSCCIGKYYVCRDGPVFTKKQLKEVKAEFGFSKRGFNGRKISLE